MILRSGDAAMSEIESMLDDYRLTTAEILYRLPDHPDLLQSYVWQHLDRIPDFPRLTRFLDFWKREIDGPLHSVRVAYVRIIDTGDWRQVDEEFTLH
jgi:uncharacterized protein Usg